jgi:hypothetical protein
MPPQMWLPSHQIQSASRETMGPYRSSGNSQMFRSANMSSLISPRPQQSIQDETCEYEDMQRGPRLSFTPEFRTMYPQQSSMPSTARSVSREQVDSPQIWS